LARALSAVAVGGHGPGLIIGKATTRGLHQSVLSKRLNPPVKWSYRKLILWWALAFLSIGWILFYTNAVTKNFSCCSVAAVDPFRAVVCSHVPTAAGSFLEAQSVHLQASLFSVGTLVPLRTLWHFNGAGLLELGNQQPRHALFTTAGLDYLIRGGGMQGGFSRRACGGDQAAGEAKESAGFGRIREDEVGIASATHSSPPQFDRLLRYEASLEAPSIVR